MAIKTGLPRSNRRTQFLILVITLGLSSLCLVFFIFPALYFTYGLTPTVLLSSSQTLLVKALVQFIATAFILLLLGSYNIWIMRSLFTLKSGLLTASSFLVASLVGGLLAGASAYLPYVTSSTMWIDFLIGGAIGLAAGLIYSVGTFSVLRTRLKDASFIGFSVLSSLAIWCAGWGSGNTIFAHLDGWFRDGLTFSLILILSIISLTAYFWLKPRIEL